MRNAALSQPGFQRTFADAILAGEAPPPPDLAGRTPAAIASRFGVYRNNVIFSLTNALAARYPVVRRLLWDDAFDALARAYVTRHPPQSPVLLEYGQAFPQFLRHVGAAAAGAYLADIAELESARVRAYHARDVAPLGRDDLARVDPAKFAVMRLALHPSMTLITSDAPVVSIWESQQPGQSGYLREWKAESALIARPHHQIEVQRLPDGAFQFLTALASGHTVAASVERAMAADARFDLPDSMTVLVAAELVVGLDPPEVEH